MYASTTLRSALACALISLVAARVLGQQTLATSHFDIPPFTAGVPVDGQGGSEPGWAAPWRKLGGFNDRGHVVTSPTQDGNGAVQIFADQIFGTSVEREWAAHVPVVRVDAYVYRTTGASMDGQIVTGAPGSGEIDPRRAGTWKVDGSGRVDVFDKLINGYISTGLVAPANQWNKYSMIADTNTHIYSFLLNDQPFNSAHPLAFINNVSDVDGINLRALQVLTSYVDNVTITSVPEPSSITLLGFGAFGLGAWGWRRRNHY